MTSIIPPLHLPLGLAGQESALSDRNSGTGPEPNFAAILAQARSSSTGELDPVAARFPLHGLKSAVAHVFNAFGFFAADNQPEPVATEVDAQSPSNALVHGAQAELAKVEAAIIDQTRSIVTTAPNTKAAGAAVTRQPAQTNPGIASGRKGPEAVPVPGLLEGMAELHRAEQSRDRQGMGVSRSHAAGGSEKRDDIHFKIGDCAVDLLARLHNLSDEEEDRLIAELQAVLEEHGLTLASATINGTPFATGLLGRIN